MNAYISQSVIQLFIWGSGLFQVILALYILVLNSRHIANRYASALFGLLAINSFAIGLLTNAENIVEATMPAIILASASPVVSIGILLASIAIIKPDWLTGRWRWFWWIFNFLSLLPTVAIAVTILADTPFWFTGLPENYSGGYVDISVYTSPEFTPIRFVYLVGVSIFNTLLVFYFSFLDRGLDKNKRYLSRILLVVQVAASLIMVASNITNLLPPPLPIISTSSLYFIAFAYVSFSEAISDRSLQRGRLQNRLTAAVLVITIPLLLFTPAYLLNQTSERINQDSFDRLQQSSITVASTVGGWLDLNTKALEQLVKQPGIISMDPKTQKPILESMDQVYDYMYLISTTDQSGVNVARSDDSNLTDYGDRSWFQQAIQGDEIAFQTLIGRTSGEPALVVSRPIFSEGGKIIGVGMFASDLNTMASVVGEINLGETGTAFVVDPKSLVVAHTNPEFANQLTDFSLHPAVVTMRKFGQETTRFRDQDESIWIAYSQELENGWAVVVEQKEDELLASTVSLQIITWVVTITGGLLSGVLTWLAIRQAIFPINSLTETATAITKGDLTRVAPIESEDEIGFLAQAFNQMTAQLLDLISNLELRISERTQTLENRSNQLEAAAEVGRITSSILDVDELIQTSVQLIKDRFNLYYVGLFLVEKSREFAVLRAGTGEAGKAMLARQHTIRVGEGMIGWAVEKDRSRVAALAGDDAVRLATQELPETRSEAAIPLHSRGQVIGAISVQSSQPEAFDESTIAILQTMADLLSVAIDNARLYTETETALKSTQRAYSELSHEDWLNILQKRPDLSFRSDHRGVQLADDPWTPEMRKAWIQGTAISQLKENGNENSYPLAIPIKVRGNVIGVIQTHKTEQDGNWTEPERIMLDTIVEQIGVALDSARLYEETQVAANNERLIGEISTQMRETLDVESVLQTAARELRAVLNLAEVEIRMGNAPETDE